LAGMLEEPIVVISVQRGSPSTGIPTKQEQGDLNMMVGGSQGDAPRIILAPKDMRDAYEITGRALNLAEKYQCPVIVLSDFFLSEHFETVEPIEEAEPIDRGKLLNEAPEDYKRFLITEDGVSPRLIPGKPKGMFVSASDEHDEKGEVISDVLAGLPQSLEIRNRMHPKRMRKVEYARREDMRLPEVVGPKGAGVTLLGWGSTYNAIQEACGYLENEGIRVNHVHFTDLYPMPQEGVLQILNSCRDIIAIENNYSSQMVRLIRAETGFSVKRTVNRYDGEPFTGEDIAQRVKKELSVSPEEELAHV